MNAPVSTSEDLLYSVENGIARLTFNRPQARNALTFAMYERMASICESINQDRSIKALILTGAGDKAFASGTDINQFRAFTTPDQAIEYESRLDRVLSQLEQCRVPTIGSGLRPRKSDFRSRARWAIACRCRPSAGSRP